MFSNIRAKFPRLEWLQELCRLVETGKVESVDITWALLAMERYLQDVPNPDARILGMLLAQVEDEYSLYHELRKHWN